MNGLGREVLGARCAVGGQEAARVAIRGNRELRRVGLEKVVEFSGNSVSRLGSQSVTGIRSSFHRVKSLADEQDLSGAAVAKQGHQHPTDEEGLNFFDRLVRAWHILFPSRRKLSSNAEIAKQRLRMILISDRCSVNDEAKRRIVNNIVGALSDFVEIESEEKVQLTVSSDPDLGTVYSVTVPVRRVKPEYQDYSRELQTVAYSEEFKAVDIRLGYPDSMDAQG